MSAFAGVLALDGAPVELDLMETLARPAEGNLVDELDLRVEGPIGLSCALARVTPESVSERQPLIDDESGCAVVFDGRLDNREALRAQLPGLSGDDPDPAYLLAGYLKWQNELPCRLIGDFAFAVWDLRRRSLLLARDPFGVRPLYYADLGDRFLFASTLEQLLRHEPLAIELNERQLLAGLYSLPVPAESFYARIERVPGGMKLTVRDGTRELRPYWQWPEEPPRDGPAPPEHYEELRALLAEAVRCRLRSAGPAGLLLSGGIDSGSIASTAGHIGEADKLRTYSFHSDRFPTIDERSSISEVVRAYGLRHRSFLADDHGPLTDFGRWLPVFTEPLFRAVDPVFYPLLDAARDDGVRTMLTGDGGDPVFTGSTRYFAARLLRGRIPSLHRQIAWAADGPGYSYKRRAFNYARIVLEDVVLPFMPTPLSRLGDGTRRAVRRRRKRMPSGLDVPEAFPSFSGPNAWWYELRRDITFVWPHQHEHFDRLMRRFGLEVRYPLLDVRLAELTLRTPPGTLFRDGRTKALLRDGLEGIVPPGLYDRHENPNLLPLIHHGLREQNASLVRALTRDPAVERRGYVAAGWSRRLDDYLSGAEQRPDWAGLVLELWLRHREGRLPDLGA